MSDTDNCPKCGKPLHWWEDDDGNPGAMCRRIDGGCGFETILCIKNDDPELFYPVLLAEVRRLEAELAEERRRNGLNSQCREELDRGYQMVSRRPAVAVEALRTIAEADVQDVDGIAMDALAEIDALRGREGGEG